MARRRRGRPRSLTGQRERRLRVSLPGVTLRTIRNAGQVEKVVRLLKPRRWTYRWLLRPQDDRSLRPRRSICYALGALMPTTAIRLRYGSRQWLAKLEQAFVLDNKAHSTPRERVDEIAVEVFAERLCKVRPTAAEAMRLVRAWRRRWERKKERIREVGVEAWRSLQGAEDRKRWRSPAARVEALAQDQSEDPYAIPRAMWVSMATDICTDPL